MNTADPLYVISGFVVFLKVSSFIKLSCPVQSDVRNNLRIDYILQTQSEFQVGESCTGTAGTIISGMRVKLHVRYQQPALRE